MKRKRTKTIVLLSIFFVLLLPVTAFAHWENNYGAWYYYAADSGWDDYDCWIFENGKTYYINSSRMQTGWTKVEDQWHYFNQDGSMVYSQWVGNFYIGADGSLLTNTTTPDGYQVDSRGAYIKDGVSTQTVSKAQPYFEKYSDSSWPFISFREDGQLLDLGDKYEYTSIELYEGYPDGDYDYLQEPIYTGSIYFTKDAVYEFMWGGETNLKDVYHMGDFLKTNQGIRALRLNYDPCGWITYTADLYVD